MKNFIITLLLALTGLFVSCSSNSTEPEEIITPPASISLSKDKLEFDSNEDYQTVNVTASGEWIVSGGASWCNISPEKEKGNQTVTITVSNNEGSEDRTTEITFRCGSATTKLSVVQYGKLDTDYVDMKLDNEGVTTKFDEQTGQVTIEYKGITPPAIKEGKSIVLPAEYEYGIRVINSVKVSGNTVVLGTEQGSMANLFRNMEFTLTTAPNLFSKSRSTGRIVTPVSVELIDENGKGKLLYNKEDKLSSRGEIYGEVNNELFSFHKNFSGQTLYEGSSGTIEWNGLDINLGLNMTMSFVWGEMELHKLKLGELNSFKISLDGDLNISMILAYLMDKEAELGEKEKVVKNNIVKANFKFMVGPVPVFIAIDVDMLKDLYVSSTGSISMTTGGDFQTSGEIGMAWNKSGGVSAVREFNGPKFNFYKPGFTVNGSLEARASLYPKLNFTIYDMIGPWFTLSPYAEAILEGKYEEEMGETPEYGWSFDSSVGLVGNMGLEMSFASVNTDLWTSDEHVFFKKDLYKAPTKIEVDPALEDAEMEVGKEMEVKFNVSGKNLLTDEDVPCPIAFVELETEGELVGESETPSAVSDENGVISVKWIPNDTKHKLKAKVLDVNNNTITEATFAPSRKNTEREALRLLYESTNGDHWKDTTNWLTSAHISEWYGVRDVSELNPQYINQRFKDHIFPSFYTGSEELVNYINLDNNNLTGDAIVSGFSFLEVLNIGNNNLNSLTIKDCAVTSLFMLDGFANLKLKELNLSDIYFSTNEEIPRALAIRSLNDNREESPIYIEKVNISDIKQNNITTRIDNLISDKVNLSDCSIEFFELSKGEISSIIVKNINNNNKGGILIDSCSVSSVDISDCSGSVGLRVSSCDKATIKNVQNRISIVGLVKTLDISDSEYVLFSSISCNKATIKNVQNLVKLDGSLKFLDISNSDAIFTNATIEKLVINACTDCHIDGNVNQLIISNMNQFVPWDDNTFIPSVTVQNCTFDDVYIASMTGSSATIDKYIEEVLESRENN